MFFRLIRLSVLLSLSVLKEKRIWKVHLFKLMVNCFFSHFYQVCISKRFFHSRSSHFTFGSDCTVRIGYRLRWRSDIWRTDRGVAEVRSPGIRPATDDDIRHNAPGLLETVDQLLRTKVRRKLQNQDKPSRLASYALQQHKAKSARLAASEFSFLLAVLRHSRWVRAVEQAWDENFETSASDGRAW